MPVRPVHIEIKSPTPAAPTVTPEGAAGTTVWNYAVVAVTELGHTTDASVAGTTAIGNATLTAANRNKIDWAAVTGASRYRIYRTAAGGTPNTTGLIRDVPASTLTYTDTGDPATGIAPAVNTTGTGRPLFVGAAEDLTLALGGTFTGVNVQFKGSNDGTTWIDEGAALTNTGARASTQRWLYVQAVCAAWVTGVPTGTAASA